MNVNYRIPDLEGFHSTNAFIGEGTVEITCADPSADIDYTTDGSVSTLESSQYTVSLKITETTDFTFRTFRPNGKKGDIVKTRYIKSDYASVTDVTTSHNSLQTVWYEFKRNGTYNIEDIVILASMKGNIELIINGYFNVSTDGIYTFALLSDDGSTLKVDDDGTTTDRIPRVR